jgi:hypothetical protein
MTLNTNQTTNPGFASGGNVSQTKPSSQGQRFDWGGLFTGLVNLAWIIVVPVIIVAFLVTMVNSQAKLAAKAEALTPKAAITKSVANIEHGLAAGHDLAYMENNEGVYLADPYRMSLSASVCKAAPKGSYVITAMNRKTAAYTIYSSVTKKTTQTSLTDIVLAKESVC